jgi:hypothetical protein
LAIHCAAPQTARAEPRIWLGNISPNITHITGPQLTLKNMTYKFALAEALQRWIQATEWVDWYVGAHFKANFSKLPP